MWTCALEVAVTAVVAKRKQSGCLQAIENNRKLCFHSAPVLPACSYSVLHDCSPLLFCCRCVHKSFVSLPLESRFLGLPKQLKTISLQKSFCTILRLLGFLLHGMDGFFSLSYMKIAMVDYSIHHLISQFNNKCY